MDIHSLIVGFIIGLTLAATIFAFIKLPTTEQATVKSQLIGALLDVEGLSQELSHHREALASIENVVEKVANDALVYGWNDHAGSNPETVKFTEWAKSRAYEEVVALEQKHPGIVAVSEVK